jgi:hypothetical protein
MKIVVHVPDEIVEPVKWKLERGPTGVLEAVALDAILGYLQKLAKSSSK